MFKKETKLSLFSGLKVVLSTGEEGAIAESFGQSGKFKVRIPDGLRPETASRLAAAGGGGGGGGGRKKRAGQSGGGPGDNRDSKAVMLRLNFKKDIFNKKVMQ